MLHVRDGSLHILYGEEVDGARKTAKTQGFELGGAIEVLTGSDSRFRGSEDS